MVSTWNVDERLQKKVEDFKVGGLPKAISLEEALPNLQDKQKQILFNLNDLAEEEKEIEAKSSTKKIQKGDDWWNIRDKIRELLQEAIITNLDHLGIIQRQSVSYGAIPDPNEKWKYFKDHDGGYLCWKCGGDVMGKDVSYSVHFAEMPLAGGGEVRHKIVPWCPNCEKEPPDSGFITETITQSLRREMF